MTLGQVVAKTTEFFKTKNIDQARLDAEVLLAAGMNLKRMDLYLRFDQPVSEPELARCRELVRRRAAGEPVSIILGYKDFYGNKFIVNQNVLTPRPETELLVEQAVLFIRHQKSPTRVIDLGSGSGCVGLSIALECPNAEVTCVEKSAEALEVLRQNALTLGLVEKLKIIHGDASDADLAKTLGEFTVVVANPPYIDFNDPNVDPDVRKYEPSDALFAENHGLSCLQSWSLNWKSQLSAPGLMLMEMGWKQGPQMQEYFKSLDCFQEIKVIKDYSQHDRIIFGRRSGEHAQLPEERLNG